jgi:hypothetical protein
MANCGDLGVGLEDTAGVAPLLQAPSNNTAIAKQLNSKHFAFTEKESVRELPT